MRINFVSYTKQSLVLSVPGKMRKYGSNTHLVDAVTERTTTEQTVKNASNFSTYMYCMNVEESTELF